MPTSLVFAALTLLAGPGPGTAGGCWAPTLPPDSAAIERLLGHRTAQARRLDGSAPILDGRLDDPTWCTAIAFGHAVTRSPVPGKLSSLATVTRVLFDDDAIYVGIRLWDPASGSIRAPYPRRDDENTSDWAFVELDTRHDHRSAFSFGLNPRAVQVDGIWYDDINFDVAWNGVWQGASSIDTAGWSAEFRIPYSRLALDAGLPGTPMVWGINIYRYSPHWGESSNWSPRLPSQSGVVSGFNNLAGLVVPPGHSPFDLRPYFAMTGSRIAGLSTTDVSLGGELRYRPAPSATIDLSLHPDFGQVEADPSQLNLTAFETFLPERRPLFLESAQLFQFGVPITFQAGGTSFGRESPFYSRRIGRRAEVRCPSAVSCSHTETSPVIAALRASGRTSSGWSMGLFHAWTGAAELLGTNQSGGHFSEQVEPLTHFSAARINHEFRGGRAAVGVIGTYTGRLNMTTGTADRLPADALVVGVDGRTRFGDGVWQLTGSVLASRVSGSSAAIDALRVKHGYARPDRLDSGLVNLTDATSLTGIAAQASAERTSGPLQVGVAARLATRGFDVNDIGFARNSDWMLVTANWTWQRYRPGHLIRHWSLGSSELGAGWTLGGLRRAAVANLNGTVDFDNYWGATGSVTHELAAADPELLRGGPPILMPSATRYRLSAHTDGRKRWQATLDASYGTEAGIGSRSWSISPGIAGFVTDRLQLGVTGRYGHDRKAWQYVTTVADDAGVYHYVLGELRQTTADLAARATYAFSSHLTLQLYSEVFVTDGVYPLLREAISPRNRDRSKRVVDLGADHAGLSIANPDFSERELHVNMVMRWEFLPGSTLFLVWSHARVAAVPARFGLGHDLDELFNARGDNVLQLKLSYWVG